MLQLATANKRTTEVNYILLYRRFNLKKRSILNKRVKFLKAKLRMSHSQIYLQSTKGMQFNAIYYPLQKFDRAKPEHKIIWENLSPMQKKFVSSTHGFPDNISVRDVPFINRIKVCLLQDENVWQQGKFPECVAYRSNVVTCFHVFMESLLLVRDYVKKSNMTNDDYSFIGTQLEVLTDLYYSAKFDVPRLSSEQQSQWMNGMCEIDNYRTILRNLYAGNLSISSVNATNIIAPSIIHSTPLSTNVPRMPLNIGSRMNIPEMTHFREKSYTFPPPNLTQQQTTLNFPTNSERKEEKTMEIDSQMENLDISMKDGKSLHTVINPVLIENQQVDNNEKITDPPSTVKSTTEQNFQENPRLEDVGNDDDLHDASHYVTMNASQNVEKSLQQNPLNISQKDLISKKSFNLIGQNENATNVNANVMALNENVGVQFSQNNGLLQGLPENSYYPPYDFMSHQGNLFGSNPMNFQIPNSTTYGQHFPQDMRFSYPYQNFPGNNFPPYYGNYSHPHGVPSYFNNSNMSQRPPIRPAIPRNYMQQQHHQQPPLQQHQPPPQAYSSVNNNTSSTSDNGEITRMLVELLSSRNAPRSFLPKITDWHPKFSGSDDCSLIHVLEQWEKLASNCGMSNEVLLSQVHMLMRNEALRWHNSIGVDYNDWFIYKNALINRFQSPDRVVATFMSVVNEQRENEKFDIYFARLKMLMKQAAGEISNKQLVTRLLVGLKDTRCRDVVRRYSSTNRPNWEKIIEEINQIETEYDLIAKSHRGNNSHREGAPSTSWNFEKKSYPPRMFSTNDNKNHFLKYSAHVKPPTQNYPFQKPTTSSSTTSSYENKNNFTAVDPKVKFSSWKPNNNFPYMKKPSVPPPVKENKEKLLLIDEPVYLDVESDLTERLEEQKALMIEVFNDNEWDIEQYCVMSTCTNCQLKGHVLENCPMFFEEKKLRQQCLICHTLDVDINDCCDAKN